MSRATNPTCAIENPELRRPDSPIASELSRHDVKMVVRNDLPAIDAIVLKRKHA